MKKQLIIIIVMVLVFVCALFTTTLKLYKNKQNILSNSGYILQAEKNEYNSDQIEKFYFNTNTSYKKKYNNKVEFLSTDGETISTNTEKFIHYTDESISSFNKGVILDFSDIEKQPIIYYNIPENVILKKSGNTYGVSTLNNDLKLTDYIYKISDEKYIVVSKDLEILFFDGNKKSANNYLEIEYIDNEVIRLYNESVSYQSVASSLRLNLQNGITIDLDNKVVLKNGDKKMTLSNMIINSDDNIDIIDLDAYKDDNQLAREKEEKEREEEEKKKKEEEKLKKEEEKKKAELAKQQKSEQVNQTNTDTITNNTTTIVGINGNLENNSVDNNNSIVNEISGSTIEIDNSSNENNGKNENNENNELPTEGENSKDKEEILEETKEVNLPEFTIEEFEVDAVGMNASIDVKDEDGLLSSEYTINIYQNETGKIIYTTTENTGSYKFDIVCDKLSPDKDYTLGVIATYTVEDVSYTRNFIYKIFKTDNIGINIEKNYFTYNTMDFYVNINEKSKVQNALVQLLDTEGNEIVSYNIDKTTQNITFYDLEADKEYTVKVSEIYYGNQIIDGGYQFNQNYKTLKQKPTLGNPEYFINKRESNFELSIDKLEDPNEGIVSFRYEIYELKNQSKDAKPISVIEVEKNEKAIIEVNDLLLYRNSEYYFKVIVEFFDNEKYIEYESGNSNVMIMDSAQFPTVTFESKNITFERIEGNLIITDDFNTIDLTQPLTVTYTDSVGESHSFSSLGNLVIPIDINNLRANETYKFSIYGEVDLQDGNGPIHVCYIGGAVVKTELPEALVAKFNENKDDVINAFSINLKLSNSANVERTLEAQTLTGMTVSIYTGKSITGTPKKTMPLVDINTAPYESSLMDIYYTNTATITPAYFGLKNSDFRDKNYLIVISQAYDYTDYKNNLPIVNNTYEITTSGYMPDLPEDYERAIEIQPIRNRSVTTPRKDLYSSTIVGYKVMSSFNNSNGYAKTITYNAYDVNNNFITSQTLDVKENDITMPVAIFDVYDGTYYTEDDSNKGKLLRGNTYYFTYTLTIDLDGDGFSESQYPYEVNGKIPTLRSGDAKIEKQEPQINIYPAYSTNNTITYKYNITDVDKTILKDKDARINGEDVEKIYANIDQKLIYNTPIEIKNNKIDFSTLEVQNLNLGDYKLYIYKSIHKEYGIKEYELFTHYFEGEKNLSELRYNVVTKTNSVDIELFDPTGNLVDRISGIDITFISKDNNEELLKLKDKQLVNNIISIDFDQISELCGKECIIDIDAWFDNGILGYEIQDAEYYVFQKAYVKNDDIFYYNLSNEYVETKTGVQNLKYTFTKKNNVLNIINVMNNKSFNWELTLSQQGYLHNYDIVLPKKLVCEKIKVNETNELYFTEILPGVSFNKKSSGDISFNSDLKSTRFTPTLYNLDNSGLTPDSEIYIELYSTDENGSNEKYIDTIIKQVKDFGSEMKLDDLTPKTYYFIRLYSYRNGASDKVYLYDIDYQVDAKKYYFSTLADVGISKITVDYNAESYDKKNLVVNYNLATTLGFDKIDYELYKYNKDQRKYEIILDNSQLESSTIIKSKMEKYINIAPGSIIQFGEKYKIKISPIAILSETGEEVDVGTKEYEFDLSELKIPYIVVEARRDKIENNITCNVTVYDDDYIIVDSKYSFVILDKDGNDITPDKYKDKLFSIEYYRKFFEVSVNNSKSAYKIKIIAQLDKDNTGNNYTTFVKELNLNDLSNKKSYLGSIVATTNQTQTNLIDLTFYDSYNIKSIQDLKYTVYNSSGYSTSGIMEFVPTRVELEDNVFYTITLPININTPGKYYIEVQGTLKNETLDNSTIEYIYIDK